MSNHGRVERKARRLSSFIRRDFDGEVQSLDVRCWSCGAVVARLSRRPAGSLVAGDELVPLGEHEHPWAPPATKDVDAALSAERDDPRRVSLRAIRP